jgi:hypothetical protein
LADVQGCLCVREAFCINDRDENPQKTQIKIGDIRAHVRGQMVANTLMLINVNVERL